MYQDFVVVDTVANLKPLKMDVIVYCSENPGAALDSELSIDYESQKLQIDSILNDFRLLAQPLEAYIRDNPSFPWTEQGLQALVKPATTGNPPRSFPEGGYIDVYPNRPLGQENTIMSVSPLPACSFLTKFNLWVPTELRVAPEKMPISSIPICPTSTTSINCR